MGRYRRRRGDPDCGLRQERTTRSPRPKRRTWPQGVAAPSIAETKAIAEEGFIYGLPIVMNYAVMYEYAVDTKSSQFKAPFNQINNEHRVATYEDTAIITPNSDTPYSILWLDLRAEPMVISVPAVDKKRYYSVQLIDGNTYNYGYIGSRATGSEPGDYLVVGPDWKGETPAGIKKVFSSTTPFALAVYPDPALQSRGHAERGEGAGGLQGAAAFRVPQATRAAGRAEDRFPPGHHRGDQGRTSSSISTPPSSSSRRRRRTRRSGPSSPRIGIGPGKTFEFKDLSLEHKAAVLLGMKEGDDKVDKFLASGMKNINGWNIGSFFGDRAFYKGDWLMRAGAAKGGLYGNDAVEAMYPFTRTDATGETLDGSKHNYTITFPAGQLPPVNAFWSVTMYDGKSQFLIKNPINRYLINSPMLPGMKKNADGSLTLYIQKDSPGKAKEANWLPAPERHRSTW